MHAQSFLTLCDPMNYSLSGSSVHGVSQAKILECIAISSSRESPDPGTEPTSPALAARFFTTQPLGKSRLCNIVNISWIWLNVQWIYACLPFYISYILGFFVTAQSMMHCTPHSEGKEKSESESRSVLSDSLWPHGLYSLWNSPGQNTGVWVAFPFSRGFSPPRDQTQVSCIAGEFFTSWATREAIQLLMLECLKIDFHKKA